jgi:hypothetical protein
MSITRLQQARQMYAMGQRVGRIAFGGGGSYVSGGGSDKYQGGSAAPGSAESKGMGGQGSSYSSPSDHNETYGNTNTATDAGGYVSEKNLTGTLTGDDYQKAEEKYITGVGEGYLQELYDNPQKFKGIFGIPTPFSIGANFASPFLHKMKQGNIDFFRDKVLKSKNRAGYVNTLESYKEYMKNRLGGQTDAYGNTHPNYMTDSKGNYILRDGGGGEGVMDVVVDETDDDTTTTDDFFSRYLQNQPEDVRKEIEARMQNFYTV